MPRGADAKREREYEHLKEEFKEEGRYAGREEEVAARVVNKQRAQHGETNAAREQDRRGESPDRDLPLQRYDDLTVDEVQSRAGKLSKQELQHIRDYEQRHQDRTTLLEWLDLAIKQG